MPAQESQTPFQSLHRGIVTFWLFLIGITLCLLAFQAHKSLASDDPSPIIQSTAPLVGQSVATRDR